MGIIVSDAGFGPEGFNGDWSDLEGLAASGSGLGLDLPSDTDLSALTGKIGEIAMIRVDFPSFADGRGFSIARGLRRMGYTGRLRARGHVLADQYAMARRSGFDEVEIDESLAARQPEAQWQARADWQGHDPRRRLGQRTSL